MSPLLAGLFERLADMAEPGLRDAYLTVLAAELRQAPVAAGFMLSAALDVRLLRVLGGSAGTLPSNTGWQS